MLLSTLGGLALEGSSFRRPKPLLLLAYLAIEGPADRGRLATLFWPDHDRPRQNLAVAVSQLRSGAPGALSADAGRLGALVACDAKELVAAATAGDWRRALRSHRGPFLDGYPVSVGAELEGWILETRDYLGGMLGSALVAGALERIEARETQPALELAEQAYRIFEAGVEIEPRRLVGLHRALSRLGSPHAEVLRREAARIGVELGAEPAAPPARPTKTSAPQLPPRPASPLVGRDRELGELRGLLEGDTRQVTITGFSGAGKSRLALELCHEAVATRAFERVFFVPMEPVSHPEAALGHLTSSVGFTLPAGEPSAPALARYLDQRRTLLVLDGMEHLASWAPHLEELAADTERLAIVATSTRPLASRDETLFLLEGLDLTPAPQDPRTSRCAAVRYFAERARRALPGFTAETDVETVWRVCARVGGLPLGLELAAGFVRVLSLRELAERLEERPEEIAAVTAGVPERHGSLLRVCEHAWSFLDDGERAVLSALSVFRESFAVADLEAVCGPALADLARLERRSLVRGDGDRYALHPLIRRFAAGRLADDPAAETAARDRHAAHFASVMQGLQGLEGGITEGEARWAAERALPDAIAAWRWSVERGAEENLVRLLTFMRSALNAMGRNALIDELIVTGLARVGPLSSAAARLKLALAQQVIHLDRRKARGLATAAAAAAAASDDVVSEGLAVLTLAATEDPSRGLESTRPLVRAALGRLREARSWELVASSYRALAVAEPSPRRHGALLALGMRYMRRFGFLSASTALSYYLGSHLTDTCGDHRAALAVTLEHLRSELDGAARPYALVAIHSLVAYYSLNAGDLDAARQHHEEALELTGRRAEAPEPVYWSPETHWVAWAAPLVALHTAGPGHALRSGRDQLEPREVRDLLAHAMLACGDREGALAAADRWRRRAASLPVVRFRVLAQAISERLQATLACDHEAQRRHLATALRTCARHHLVPMALDCLVSCHRLFPDVVSQEEAVAAATHPAAYHSAPLLLTGFRGPVPAKLARAPYPGTEALRRGAALAERLWC